MRSLARFAKIAIFIFFGLTPAFAAPSRADDARPLAAETVLLPVTPLRQACPSLCWAAAAQMIAGYYGVTDARADQCVMASVKAGYGTPVCCLYGCGFGQCDSLATEAELTAVLTAHLGLREKFLPRPLTEEELREEIAAGRPVIIRLQGPLGHVVVIRGYSVAGGSYFYDYIDPAIGQGKVTYDQLRSAYKIMNGAAPWIQTWVGSEQQPLMTFVETPFF